MTAIDQLRKFVAPEFIFGPGAADLVGQYAKNFGAKRVFLVSDPGVIAAGWMSRVVEKLGEFDIPSVSFSAITPNPKDTEVMTGAGIYQRENCDIIICVGGGSPMDCAKAIGVVASNQKSVLDFEGVDEIEIPGPPLICIPTTAGTSADVSQFSIITDTTRQVKIAIVSKTMVPDVALIDPLTTYTMDSMLTAATGLDALCHAFEASVSNASSPVTDLNALEAVRLVGIHLPQAVADGTNAEARNQMMLGSMLAGLAFSNASLGLVHAMAHSLGGLFGSPHGECNAILLGPVVRYNFFHAPANYRRIGAMLGLQLSSLDDAAACEKLVQWLMDFRIRLGIKHHLRDMGVTPADLPRLAEKAAADPCLLTNPRPATMEEIVQVYEQAL